MKNIGGWMSWGVGLSLILTGVARADLRFVQVEAHGREDRSAIADAGVSIEEFRSDSVWGFASEEAVAALRARGLKLIGNFDASVGRAGEEGALGFPSQDSRYHTYDQATAALQDIARKNADIARLVSLGKSLEGREIWALHLNTAKAALASGKSNKPGVIYLGNHHGREHLSLEVPLMWAQYLTDHRKEAKIAGLLAARDVWIVPMVNPDGAEFDVSTGKYKLWRKNRAHNYDGTSGVDLNRNYGFKWGTGGSSNKPKDETYMGPAPFSEPETQAVKRFVEALPNVKVLLTFHTYSELVLYPWGHTYDEVGSSKDLAVFKAMAQTMAGWNHYKPMQASGLYIASGDTTDWAYGEHGIFAFTFEMSPRQSSGIGGIVGGGAGFYPGAGMVDRAFQDNLQPCLYLLSVADDPHRTVGAHPAAFLKSYVEPALPEALMWEVHPLAPVASK